MTVGTTQHCASTSAFLVTLPEAHSQNTHSPHILHLPPLSPIIGFRRSSTSARIQIDDIYEQWLSTQRSFVRYRTSSTESVLIDITDHAGHYYEGRIGIIV